jgi:hypothetical protein
MLDAGLPQHVAAGTIVCIVAAVWEDEEIASPAVTPHTNDHRCSALTTSEVWALEVDNAANG